MDKVLTGDGCPIAYRWDGDPALPVLLLSNSIATDHRMWDNVIGDLSRTRCVLRYDARGHGGSGAPAGAYSLDRLGRDVVELLDRLEIEKVDFCGLSLGGMVGQWLGIHAGDRIDRLILSNTAPYLGPAQQWDALIDDLAGEADMSAMADMFLGNWFPAGFASTHPDIVGSLRETILATPPQGLAGCFAVVRDMDLRRTDTLIRNRALVLGGEFDTVTLPSHSREIAAAVENAELVMLPGVHLLNVERRDEFVSALSGFLGNT